MRIYTLVLTFLVCWWANATLFSPVSIKEQLRTSDGVVIGTVLSQESEFNDENKIVTKVNLQIDQWIGSHEQDELGQIEIYIHGGKIGDQVRKIEGTPEFKLGEQVTLLTKDHKSKVWVYNLGLGKYTVKKLGTQKILVNQIFPNNPLMGQIKYNEFVILAERIKKQEFQVRYKDKQELNNKKLYYSHSSPKTKSQGRSIASIRGPEVVEEKKEKISLSGLVLFLGALALGYGAIRKKFS